MPTYRLHSAFLPQGWTRGVLVTVSAQGMITAVESSTSAQPDPHSVAQVETVDGFIVPGMPNAHSHAFQRAMAGNTEFRTSARDSFWTWRQTMYALANRMGPEDLSAVATQLFVEMLKSGYTSVAEFHYLHRPSGAEPYCGANLLWEAVRGAADRAGIGLTFLPTLYQSSDFGDAPLKKEQARFALQTDHFLRGIEQLIGADATHRTGAAFHSLRAVPLTQLRRAALALHDIDSSMPVHIHIAEQSLEVSACRRATGRRPIELLLDQEILTPQWSLIHATHATLAELRGIASAGAGVCVSISTEANLGDGWFDAPRFLQAGGRLCIGSDSQATVSPGEELRWLEYQQRLRKRRRVILAAPDAAHVGTRLWRDTARCGAVALGQPVGQLAVGHRADWLVLDRTHPSLAGASLETTLDRLIFAGADRAIRDVMVAGRWVIRDYHHAADDQLRAGFAGAMKNLTEGIACSLP